MCIWISFRINKIENYYITNIIFITVYPSTRKKVDGIQRSNIYNIGGDVDT